MSIGWIDRLFIDSQLFPLVLRDSSAFSEAVAAPVQTKAFAAAPSRGGTWRWETEELLEELSEWFFPKQVAVGVLSWDKQEHWPSTLSSPPRRGPVCPSCVRCRPSYDRLVWPCPLLGRLHRLVRFLLVAMNATVIQRFNLDNIFGHMYTPLIIPA